MKMEIPTNYLGPDNQVCDALFHLTNLSEADKKPEQVAEEIAQRLLPWAKWVAERYHTERADCLADIVAELLLVAHYHGLGELLPTELWSDLRDLPHYREHD